MEKEIIKQGIYIREILINQEHEKFKNHQQIPGTPAGNSALKVKNLRNEIAELKKEIENV
jgi:hypothetical protein